MSAGYSICTGKTSFNGSLSRNFQVLAVDVNNGFGVGQDPSSGAKGDDHWTIAAVQASFTTLAGQSIGYAANVQQYIGANWFASTNTGLPFSLYNEYVSGGQTTYWIAAQDSV